MCNHQKQSADLFSRDKMWFNPGNSEDFVLKKCTFDKKVEPERMLEIYNNLLYYAAIQRTLTVINNNNYGHFQ